MPTTVEFLFPKILFYKKTEDGFECGPIITDLDTGIYYSKYEYGRIFKAVLLGFGIYITWIYL